MKKMRVLALLLALMLIASGCTGKKAVEEVSVSDSDLAQYPIKGDYELVWWRQLDVNLSTTYTNQAEAPYEKELAKRTGVKVKYLHPAAGSVNESFNILISSGDLPDLISYPWQDGYPGGIAKAIKDKHIRPINDLMEKYMPNFSAALEKYPEAKKALRTDEGDYYGPATINTDDLLLYSAGLMIRKDWLDELGLPEPETMDEIYETLKAMKEKKGVELPYSGNVYSAATWGIFVSAYGIMPELYVDGKEVKYGSIDARYKDYLTTMNKWYNEGLIDNSFATLDSKTVNSNIMNGFSAMTQAAGGAGLGTYLQTAKTKNPSYDLVALKSPVLKKGDKPMYSKRANPVSSPTTITTDCKIPQVAAKFLDYRYSEEGSLMANFGIEGESYTMVDGNPVYTDLIMHNPDGKTPSAMMAQYRANGAFISDPRYIMQYYELPQQQEALVKWGDCNAALHQMPPLTIADDVQAEISTLYADIQTYTQSMTLKYIMGTEDLAGFDSFVENVKKMGVDRVLKAYTEALERYNAR